MHLPPPDKTGLFHIVGIGGIGMLPDDNVDEALTSLNKLEQEHGVLERDIAAVDLRLLDRVTVRLHETASVSPGDAAAPQELPTASTKGTKAKGKT